MSDLQNPSQLSRLERKLDQLTEAVAKLVLLEERQITQASRLTVAEKGIADLAEALRESDKRVEKLINRGIGVWLVIAVIGGATFTVLLKLVR